MPVLLDPRPLGQRVRARVGEFLRSCAAGVLASGADLTTLFVLVNLVGLTAAMANVPALLVGAVTQFAANKYFAFRDYSRGVLRQGMLFALAETGTFTLNAIGYHLVVTYTATPYLLARMVVTFLVFSVFSFPLWRRIFRPSIAEAQRS